MHSMRAPDGAGPRFAQAEITNLALPNEPGHGSDGIFNRHVRVDAMDVIEIDDIDPHAFQAGLTGNRDVIRSAVHSAALPVRPADVTELGGNEIFVPPSFDGLADELLVDAGRVGIGRIQHIDAKLRGAMDSCYRLHIVGNAV